MNKEGLKTRSRYWLLRLVADAVVSFLLAFILLAVWQFIFNRVYSLSPALLLRLNQLIQTTIILVCTLGFFYNKLWSKAALENRKRIFLFTFFVGLLFFAVYNLLSIHHKAMAYFRYISSDSFISWDKNMYEKDDVLGYKLIADNTTSFVYNYLPASPVKTDVNGYRIPMDQPILTDISKPVDLLFVGCSYTFGSACKAEETFPYLVAQQTGLNYINAATEGYGLAHMYLLSQQHILLYKPTYIILQSSPWLIERAVREFAPSRGGYLLPVPYFSDSAELFKVEKPVYKSSVGTLSPAKDRKQYSGQLLHYYFQKGFPYFLREQIKTAGARYKNIIGQKAYPTKRNEEAELFFYRQIIALARASNTKVILLNLSNGPASDKVKKIAADANNVQIADADALLYEQMGGYSADKYRKKYAHWGIKNGDSVFADSHPNSYAHQLIARSILAALKK